MKKRNLLLVVIWSYGLFIIIHMYQYIGGLMASWVSGQKFDVIMSGSYESSQTDLIISLSSLIIGVPFIFLVIKYLWKRSFEWMCLKFNYKKLAYGLTLGLLPPMVVLLILKILGCAHIYWCSFGLQLDEKIVILGYACLAIFTGIAEEVVFRGIIVREFARKYRWVVAAVVGGVIFGLPHLINIFDNTNLLNVFQVLLASVMVSFLFVALYIRTHSLWVPIGFHMSWNFCLKGILGLTMSGNSPQIGFLDVKLIGSQLLTGGSFGIEASIISIIVYFIMALLFYRFHFFGKKELLSHKYEKKSCLQ